MKRLLIIITIIALAVGAFFAWYFLPVNVIERAFDNDDYEVIVNNYYKLKTENDKENVKIQAVELMDKYYNAYLRESKDYKEVDRFYKLMMSKEFGDDDRFIDYRESFETIKTSRDNYEAGEKLMKKEKYLSAYEKFELVSDEDKNYRRRTESSKEECKEKYIAEIISNAEALSENGYIDEAYSLVEEALVKFPEDKELQEELSLLEEMRESKINAANDITGSWYVKYDMGKELAYYMGISGYDISFPLNMIFEFDGSTLKLYVDESSIKPALDYLTENHMDALYEVASSYGIKPKEADTFVKWTYGGSYSSFILDNFGDEISKALKETTNQYDYVIENGDIILTNGNGNEIRFSYSVSGKELILDSYEGNDSIIGLFEYPLKLNK